MGINKLLAIQFGLASLIVLPATAQKDSDDASLLLNAIRKVEAQCPVAPSGEVVVVPGRLEIAEMSGDALISLLESWNPAVRKGAVGELSKRDGEQLEKLRAASLSESWNVRAGSAAALAKILSERLKNWQEYAPVSAGSGAARTKISKELNLAAIFLRLAKDSRTEVRFQAMQGLVSLGPINNEVTVAMILFCQDEDAFLAQESMIFLEKRFSTQALQEEVVITALHASFKTPLPRGRGHMVRLIAKMKPEDQKKFIPELLDHVSWQPLRDTMFGSGGKSEAIRILTDLRVTEVLPRLLIYMDMSFFGSNPVKIGVAAIKKFGSDAKIILPELRKKTADSEIRPDQMKERHSRRRKERYDLLRAALADLEKL